MFTPADCHKKVDPLDQSSFPLTTLLLERHAPTPPPVIASLPSGKNCICYHYPESCFARNGRFSFFKILPFFHLPSCKIFL